MTAQGKITANLPSDEGETPRMTAPFELGGGAARIFALTDPDGSLWRVMEGQDTA